MEDFTIDAADMRGRQRRCRAADAHYCLLMPELFTRRYAAADDAAAFVVAAAIRHFFFAFRLRALLAPMLAPARYYADADFSSPIFDDALRYFGEFITMSP